MLQRIRPIMALWMIGSLLIAACVPQKKESLQTDIPPTSVDILPTITFTTEPTLAPTNMATAVSPTATITPWPTVTPEPTSETTGATGTVAGQLYYPSEGIPVMNLYFESISTGEVITVPIAQNQLTYMVNLPEGTYLAYAWTVPSTNPAIPKLSGGFTNTSREYRVCDYFDLQPITVAAGQTVSGVDIYNWYAPQSAFPPPPGESLGVGTLEGYVLLPNASQNPTTVYSLNVATGKTITTTLSQNTNAFRFENLPAGWYYIYSWTQASNGKYIGGSHSIEGKCGDIQFCERRCMTPIEVWANEITSDVDVVEWYDELIVYCPTRSERKRPRY